MPPTRTRALAPALVVVLSLALLITGCGVSEDEPSGQSTASATPEPEPTDTETPSETASGTPTDTGAASPTAAPSPSLSPDAALLTAAEMPPLNDAVPWQLRDSGPISSRPFGLCQKFDVLSIGAEQAVERRFVLQGGGPDSAAQEIATFPDTATVARAGKVLRAWHRDCATRVRGRNVKVRPIQSVPVSQGQGWWYLVSYARRGEGHFHTFGVVALGTRMSLLRMDHTGQDHNYEPGQDPMQLAVKAAAGKLG